MEPFKKPAASRQRQRGVALLLLLAVVGVGAAAVLISAFSHNTQDQRRSRQTMDRMAQAKDALVGFAATYGRLPRPAISATDGHESPTPCDSEEACTGFLPWVSLGVDGADAWGKLLRYSVTPTYTNAPVLRISAIATKTVQTRFGNGQLAYLVGHDDCGLAAQCAPVVLISHGKDNFGFSTQGVFQANAAAGNVDEQLNAVGSVHFVSRPISDDPRVAGGVFDDLVTSIPLSFLYSQMAKAHRLP